MKTLLILLLICFLSCASINWQKAKNATAMSILTTYNHTYSWLENPDNVNAICKDIIVRYEPDIEACGDKICQQEIEEKLKNICQQRLDEIESKIDTALNSCALSVEIWETSLSSGNWGKMTPEQKKQFLLNVIDNISNLQTVLQSFGIPVPDVIIIIIEELKRYV